MATITIKGNPVNTAGKLPKVGETAPDFKLVSSELTEVSLGQFSGKKKVLNIFPSVDTPTCASSVRRFNVEAANLPGVAVLNISADLPFGLQRFCASEGINNVTALSVFQSKFGDVYGVKMIDGPFPGILARAVVVLDENNVVIYKELVPELTKQPNYEAALQALR